MWKHAGWLRTGIFAAGIVAASAAQAGPWTSLYIFGDSLSDSGNNAAVFDSLGPPPGTLRTPVPVANDGFIPTFPYASGRYTNQSFVWADAFAAALGLTNVASLTDPNGNNFAFGGARTGPTGGGFPYSLLDQVTGFLGATGGVAPSSALYVVEGGGNDLRDAADAYGSGGDPSPIIAAYVSNVVQILSDLKGAGAVDILLWNVPDLGLSPAARFQGPAAQAGATFLAQTMNSALTATLAALPGLAAGVDIFDVFGLLQDINADPASFGLTNVTNACAADLVACSDPADYLFWDGIHPTAAGHMLLAEGALAALPAPGTLLLVLLAGGVLVVMRLRSAGAA